MVELIQLLIDEPEVQALFSYDEIPSIDDRVAANIDKAERKVQELLVVCARLDEIVDKTKTKTKTETQRAGELVAQTRLVKAKQTLVLVKLQAIQERPRKRQKTLSLTETEKWAAVPGDAWRKMIDHVSRTLFAVPSHLQQKWTGTVSTNVVVVYWQLKKTAATCQRASEDCQAYQDRTYARAPASEPTLRRASARFGVLCTTASEHRGSRPWCR